MPQRGGLAASLCAAPARPAWGTWHHNRFLLHQPSLSSSTYFASIRLLIVEVCVIREGRQSFVLTSFLSAWFTAASLPLLFFLHSVSSIVHWFIFNDFHGSSCGFFFNRCITQRRTKRPFYQRQATKASRGNNHLTVVGTAKEG